MYIMGNIKLFDNSLESYESKNLSFMRFYKLDFSKDPIPKSFYRSDFRRSQIVECHFHKNSFGRADFVDVNVQNTIFENVNWGSCLFKNSYIQNTIYTNNNYRGVSLQFNKFSNCNFINEKFIFNAYKCLFSNCSFKNCTFEKSSLEDITFENCSFENVNIAECHAENLKFDTCKINTLKLGITYWSTYLFRYTKIEKCQFLYHGNPFDITDKNYFIDYIDTLLVQNRLYEFLNCIIINNRTLGNIAIAFEYIFPKILSLPGFIRHKNMIDILDMLNFYYDYISINFLEYNEIIAILNNYKWDDVSFEDASIYLSQLYKINRKINSCNFSVNYLKTIDFNRRCEMKIHLDYTTKEKAIKYLDNVFNIINMQMGYIYQRPYFECCQIKQGSIILTISSFLLLAVMLSYIYKRIANDRASIQFRNVLNEQLQKRLKDDSTSISDIKKICSLAEEYNILSKSVEENTLSELSKEITVGEIISIIITTYF